VREALRQRLWETADRIGWMSLSPVVKSKSYEDWTRDPQVGGLLARYIDRGQVRVYLKDTLLKDYVREHLADESRPFRVLGITDAAAVEAYIKPHGRRLGDGRVICWGRAEDWKSVLMAVHERTYAKGNARPFAAVLMQPTGRLHEDHVRELIEDAAKKLGIERIVWLDT
jgi:hypothetical protein